MKWIFLGALLLFIPTLAALLRSNPRYLVPCCVVLGLMPFIVGSGLYIAPISWATWPGPVKGIEVSVLDAMAVAILLAVKRTPVPLPFKISFVLVAIALSISTIASYQTAPAVFYVWQVFRALLLFLAVARVCANDSGAPFAILGGMGLGLYYEAVFAAIQFGNGMPKPGGSFGHANFLGLASHFVIYPSLSLALSGRKPLWNFSVVAAGVIIAVVGGSRATLGLVPVGIALTMFVSIWQKRTSAKFAYLAVASLLLSIAAPIMLSSVDRRDGQDIGSSDTQRKDMNAAARMMIADHPFGIGANQYVIVANMGGYSDKAGVSWVVNSRAAPVHNFYLLYTAENGLLGLLAVVFLFSTIIIFSARGLKLFGSDPLSEILPGLTVTFVMLTIHVYFEWIFMDFVIHYLFAISAGILVGSKYMMGVNRVRHLHRKTSPMPDAAPLSAIKAAVAQ